LNQHDIGRVVVNERNQREAIAERIEGRGRRNRQGRTAIVRIGRREIPLGGEDAASDAAGVRQFLHPLAVQVRFLAVFRKESLVGNADAHSAAMLREMHVEGFVKIVEALRAFVHFDRVGFEADAFLFGEFDPAPFENLNDFSQRGFLRLSCS
jgi:hypothetical protein